MKSSASGIRVLAQPIGDADLTEAMRMTHVASRAYFAQHGSHAARCLAAARALIAEAQEHAGSHNPKGRK